MSARLTRKALQEAARPVAKAAARYANNYLLDVKPNPCPPGLVTSHACYTPFDGAVVEWEGFTIEATICRRPRVVCGVPTPYSLFTFNYCLKLGDRQLAHGRTLPEFLDNAMRAAKRELVA